MEKVADSKLQLELTFTGRKRGPNDSYHFLIHILPPFLPPSLSLISHYVLLTTSLTLDPADLPRNPALHSSIVLLTLSLCPECLDPTYCPSSWKLLHGPVMTHPSLKALNQWDHHHPVAPSHSHHTHWESSLVPSISLTRTRRECTSQPRQ